MSSDTENLDAPIVKRKLADQVFDRLREMIASGQLAPGDTMPSERDLMHKFGVGRPAVREALQLMQTKGLIQITHGERSRVNKLTAGAAFQQVDDIAKMLLSSEPSNLAHPDEALPVKLALEDFQFLPAGRITKPLSVQRPEGEPLSTGPFAEALQAVQDELTRVQCRRRPGMSARSRARSKSWRTSFS